MQAGPRITPSPDTRTGPCPSRTPLYLRRRAPDHLNRSHFRGLPIPASHGVGVRWTASRSTAPRLIWPSLPYFLVAMHFIGANSRPELARERTNMSGEGFPIPEWDGTDRDVGTLPTRADALAEVPPGRQGGRDAAAVHRPDGGDRPGLRLLGHALELLREVHPAAGRARCGFLRHRVLLPHAPERGAGAAGELPDLRHAALEAEEGREDRAAGGRRLPGAARPLPHRPGGHPHGRGRPTSRSPRA